MAKPVVVLAPDAFKGSLGAPAVCAALERGLRRVWPEAEIRARPMADGGEGTLDAILGARADVETQSMRATRATRGVTGAGGAARVVEYGVLHERRERAAIVEVAQVVGITDVDATAVSVLDRSTRGVGELLRGLLDDGLRRFWIALGGSSTNDGGAGLLAALGVRLLDASGVEVAPTPSGLATLARVDVAALDVRLAGCSLTILSDVDAPLSGPAGATAVFGPQKGLLAADVAHVDAILARFAGEAERAFGLAVAGERGAGAAGGLGFALQLLGGVVRSGAEVVADLVDLDGALDGADWLVTGEGRTDLQTLAGKAPSVVARRARAAGVPVTCLSGSIDAAALPALGAVFDGCFGLPTAPATLSACIADAGALLADRVEQLARFRAALEPLGPLSPRAS